MLCEIIERQTDQPSFQTEVYTSFQKMCLTHPFAAPNGQKKSDYKIHLSVLGKKNKKNCVL